MIFEKNFARNYGKRIIIFGTSDDESMSHSSQRPSNPATQQPSDPATQRIILKIVGFLVWPAGWAGHRSVADKQSIIKTSWQHNGAIWMHCTYMSDVCMLKSIIDLNFSLGIQTHETSINLAIYIDKLYCCLFLIIIIM